MSLEGNQPQVDNWNELQLSKTDSFKPSIIQCLRICLCSVNWEIRKSR